MNVTLPQNSKIGIKEKLIYFLIIFICIVSIGMVIYNQFFEGKTVITIGNLAGKSEDDYNNLKANFDTIFTNKLETDYDKSNIQLKDETKDIVYTSTQGKRASTNDYDIEVYIPYINIDNDTIKEYNEEIQEFKEKISNILETKNKNTIYTVEYGAYIEDDILSLIIKSNLKEGTSAQRVIVKTYNYNLKTNKEVSFKDILSQKEVTEEYAQNRINDDIRIEQKKAEDLISVGLSAYKKNVNDDIYKVKNIKEFYVHNGSIYIVFAYGNNAHTNEMDVVIF